MTLRLAIAAAGITVLTAVPVAAHHSFAAEYDGSKPITLKGTISRMLFGNPHAHIYIDVKRPDGKVVNWNVELGGSAALLRRGWRKTDLPVGAEVTVQGYLAKDGTPSANATVIRLADGRELFAGSAGTGTPVEPPGENAKPQ
jgi:hypothetical protein